MASRHQFEGIVLEDVLDRVHDELGSGARIIAANRVRKGGLGGFFSKEHYEVIAEVGPAAPANGSIDLSGAEANGPRSTASLNGGAAHVPSSILDLAEAMNETERESVIDLDADDADDGESPEAFAQMLARLTRAAGVEGAVIDETAIGGIRIDTAAAPTAPPAAPAAPADGSQALGIEARVAEPMIERPAATQRTVAQPRVAAPRALAAAPEDLATITGTERPPVFRSVARTDTVIERPETMLARLGVPPKLIPRGANPRELRGALAESLAQLPRPPLLPEAPGVVVVVVGPGITPVVLARELSDELGLEQDGVVLATPEQLGEGIPSWLQICDAPTADERRRSWRRRNHPTIVACSLTGHDQLTWARGMLDHLEPTVTWGIIDAGWKCEDIEHWADELGGIDVFALTNLDLTVSPAAALDLGVPVGRLDDQPASPLAWTELLLDRMPNAPGVDLASGTGS